MNLPTASMQSAKPPQPAGKIDERLHGRWLLLTRIMWISTALLALGLYIVSIPTTLAALHTLCADATTTCSNTLSITPEYVRDLRALGISLDTFALYEIALLIAFAVVYIAISILLFWRRSDDRMALFASLTLMTFPAAFNYAALATLPAPWWWPSQFLILLGNSSFFLFFYLFPTGRFVPRFTRWLWIGVLIFWTVNGFFPFLPSLIRNVLFLGIVGTIPIAQIYRYWRVSNTEQRRQTKWVVFGISIGFGGFLASHVFLTFFPSLFPQGPLADMIMGTVVFLFLLLVPLSIGIAILRSHLFDIDSIINRTLVYGILTVSVVGFYVLVVGYLGALLRGSNNVVISLVATGLIAVLFHPLRAFLQRGVNHLLYGQRDEPYTVITQLSQRLEVTVAPDAVLSTIVETVAHALKLPYVAILLQHAESVGLAAKYGQSVEKPLILPLTYQTETVGQLHVAPRTPGEALTPADHRLLVELARQAGLAAHAIRLTSDLQRSHEDLEQRVEERTRELSSLLKISHTVASTLHLKPLLGLILDQLKTVVDYTGAMILAVEEEDLVLLDERGPVAEEHMLRRRFSLTQPGLLWQTITSHETVIVIQDVHDDAPIAQAFREAMDNLRVTNVQSVRASMVVPLILREQIMGVLILMADEVDAFTRHHAMLALSIATQAAIAIENAQLYAQAQSLAALEERQRLARELHDSVSQALYGIALGLHTAHIQLERDPSELPESLDYLLSLAEAALDEMRALIFELRPEALENEGLVSALSKQGAALQARHGIIVQTELCEEPDLPLRVKQALYRIAQEAMHNIVKHAHASKVNLRLSQAPAEIILEVRDDGVGFDPSGSFPGHLGLHSMRERVSSLSGTLQIESAIGEGTAILAQIPGVS